MENELGNARDSLAATDALAVSRAGEKALGALDVAIGVLEDLQRVVSGGRPKSVRIRFGDKVVAEMPVALTAVAAIAAGLAAVLLTKLAIEIEHED